MVYMSDTILRTLLSKKSQYSPNLSAAKEANNLSAKQTETNNFYLRDWQKIALHSFLKREQKKIEVTSAYQGSGKTIYAAAFYILSQLRDQRLLNLNFSEIKDSYVNSDHKLNNFCVVFIPAHSIKHTTIKAWKSLGINLIHKTNKQLQKTSLERLMLKGYNGLICTYQQADYKGFVSNEIWYRSPLINLIIESKNVKIHAILDECHEVALGTLKSKFFLDNQNVFYHLHLMSGTLVNASLQGIQSNDFKVVPFVSYNKANQALPDTTYSQEDAIRDGVIVKTKVITHPVAHAFVKVDGEMCEFTSSDLEWFCDNFSAMAFKFKSHENHNRLHTIDKAFKAVYQSKDIWRNLLIYGNEWLQNVRKVYPGAKGMIFAPSKKAAEVIHSQLLQDTSVICIARSTNIKGLQGCRYVYADTISAWLEDNDTSIDWIVSCETLKQGFDYPNCKVQILVPQLQYLHLVKMSQMLGRTNRSIEGYPSLEAVCLTIDHKPIRELLKYSQDSNFGLCYQSDILQNYTDQINYDSLKKVEAAELGLVITDKVTKITDLAMSPMTKILTPTGYQLFNYGSHISKELDTTHVKSYWSHWGSIVKRNRDYPDPELELPPELPGVYTVVNANSLEILYIGESSNLLKRISNRYRYRTLPWLVIEGANNLFIRWVVEKDYKALEEKLIRELNPKYNVTHNK